MKEYAIWGKSPLKTNEKVYLNESLLLTANEKGERITDRKEAEKLAEILESKYKCKDTRIQCIDFADSEDLFATTLSI